MASLSEVQAMQRAFELALRGGNSTFPNPMVGAVVLDPGGFTVGEGFHERCGTPHAEIVAMAEAGVAAAGGTLVVTLEPCCHHGRTGPCTEAIIGAGISRVVIATMDPHPMVCGNGALELRSAGIEVETGVLSEDADAINRVYLHFLRTGRSWLTLKMAVSLDGRIAAHDGTSRWITGEESRGRVHRIRASTQAVLTGAGTVRIDDPQLNARLSDSIPEDQPARIVVTSTGKFGESGRIFKNTGRVIIACPEGTVVKHGPPFEETNVEIWEFPVDASRGGIPLPMLLQRTASEGFGNVMCESGPGLATEFLKQELVNDLIVFTASLILGSNGIPCLGDLGIATLKDAIRLKDVTVYPSGADSVLEGEIVYRTDRG